MSAEPRKDLIYEVDSDYMLIPCEFAQKLAETLLADMPEAERAVVVATIEEWGNEWGDRCSGAALDSMRDYF